MDYIAKLHKEKSKLLTKRLKLQSDFSGGIMFTMLLDLDCTITVINQRIDFLKSEIKNK